MTTKECFDAMGADYEGVLERFSSEALVKKFALKFLDDNSYSNLEDALADGNVENAFRAAHTLKGVCLNLGFDNLYKVSSDITEILRVGKLTGTKEAFENVKEQYNITVNAIKAIDYLVHYCIKEYVGYGIRLCYDNRTIGRTGQDFKKGI